jgi:hypothetical protein
MRYKEYLEKSYMPRATKTGHRWKMIGQPRIMGTPAARFPIGDVRLLPKSWTYNPNVIWIFGDCVANVVWLDEPVAFLVEDAHVAKAYRDYFALIWKTAGG